MEFRGSQARPSRPQQPSQPAPATPVAPSAPAAPTFSRQEAPGPQRKWPLIIAIALVVAILVGALAWHGFHTPTKPRGDRYQAVFLDNGQVFFGTLKNVDGRYLRLENAYYTKKQDLPADATDEQKAAASNNVSLVQTGDEVYGPESTIQIRAEQVLFWQDLRSDSKVAKAIKDAKEE